MKTIIQLVPRMRPLNCGIGDYAVTLAEEWQRTGACKCRFLVADETWRQHDALSDSVLSLGGTAPSALQNSWMKAEVGPLLLHYSGYGYSRRGTPVWLVRAIRDLRRQRPNVRVATMFHELYAFGPPSTSAFWLSPVQRWVTSRLAGLSDVVVTNRQQSASWLEEHAPRPSDSIRILPVFSNLGEVMGAPPPSQREDHFVFFGYQARQWDAGYAGLREVLRNLKPARITILGRSEQIPEDIFDQMPVTRPGWLEPEAVSAILRTARYGLVAYNPAFLGKSGILAAFFAHGVVPLLVAGEKPLSEGLKRGSHLLAVSDVAQTQNMALLDCISEGGRSWYVPHDVQHTALIWSEVFDALR